jgi:hypothetical protein
VTEEFSHLRATAGNTIHSIPCMAHAETHAKIKITAHPSHTKINPICNFTNIFKENQHVNYSNFLKSIIIFAQKFPDHHLTPIISDQ